MDFPRSAMNQLGNGGNELKQLLPQLLVFNWGSNLIVMRFKWGKGRQARLVYLAGIFLVLQ